jgi:hypothetical protein
MKQCLIILHVILILYHALYGILIINKNKLDYIYCIFSYFLILHWTLLNGECIITYLYKLSENKNYSYGTSVTKGDLDVIFGKYKMYVVIILFILIMFNLFLICNRNSIDLNYFYLFFFIWFSYGYYLYNVKNTSSKSYFLINKFYSLVLIIFGIIFYQNII